MFLRALRLGKENWHQNKILVQLWTMFEAYYFLLKLIQDKLENGEKFRLGKFMNSVDTSRINIIIFELLYLFFSGDYRRFGIRVEQLDSHFKKTDARTRNFMRLLQWVGANNCYRYCNDQKTARYLRQMQVPKTGVAGFAG